VAEWVLGDKVGGDKVAGDKIIYAGGRRPRPKVLIMSANVDGRQPLRLDREHREIGLAILRAGDTLDLRIADALRLEDLQPSLQHHQPAIVHFSGHGSAAYGILVSDPAGRPRAVAAEALSELFGLLDKRPECVVLNACFTDDQAWAIARHVPCVIGMRGGIVDDAAIDFATAFYRGVAYGRTIGTAFGLGCNLLRLCGHPDADRPLLVPGPEAARIRVVKRPGDAG
jgi:hypothetical protein